MKPKPLFTKNLLLYAMLFLVMILGTSTAGWTQTVTTDKLDYSPGETVLITGTGFQAGEPVVLYIIHIEIGGYLPIHTHDAWTVLADSAGNITSAWYVDDIELNTTLFLTATGQLSGLTASTMFTDAVGLSNFNIGAQNGALTAGIAGSANYASSVKIAGAGSGSITVSLSISGLPAGVTFSPASFSSGNANPYSFSLVLSTTVASLPGTYPFTVTATSGSASTSGTGSLLISACTPPSAPTGTASQTFCSGNNPTVANLTATGTEIKWYDASVGGTLLASSTMLINGNHYFASQTVSGCESTARLEVTVTLNTSPAITENPTDVIEACIGSNQSFSVTASGSAPLSYQWYKGIPSTGDLISGATAATYTISSVALTDAGSYYAIVSNICGTATSTAASLTIETAAPEVAANGSSTVSCIADATAPTVPAATDSCDGSVAGVLVSTVDNPDPLICEGTRVYTYSYTDAAGNVSYWTYTYTIDDVTNPTASNPATVNVECFSDIPIPDVTVVTDEADNCEGFVNVEFVSDDITSATCDGDVVTVTRTYSVTDCSGNGISVYQTINVDDITNPTASNPSPINVECMSEIPTPDIEVVTDEADNCDGTPTVAWVSDNAAKSGCDGATATVTRTYSVTDCSGNSIEVTQAINVDDVTNPTASNPATVNVECFSDIPIPDVTVVTDEADNCEGFVNVEFVSDDITSATCDGDVVTVTRTYSVTDCSGNGISVYQTINVDDITNPTASNPSPINVECMSEIPTPDETVVTDEADNCDGTPTVAWVSDNAAKSGCDGATATITRTYSVTDCSGNSIEVTQAINVDDVTNPTASNPATVNVECFSDIPIPDVTVVTDEADNCEGFVNVEFVSDDITSATCDGDVVAVTRTYSVTDCSGNSINVIQTINVDDITNPTASNPSPINVECMSEIPTPDIEVVTDEADNCDGTPTVAWVSDNAAKVGCDGATATITRTYSVTDCSGNSIEVTQAINVDDVTNPTASDPAAVNVECFSDIPIPDVTVVTDEADNCEGFVNVEFVSDDITSATCDGDVVEVTRTYSVTDCSGNGISVYQTINVDDITNPTASNPATVNVECFSDIPIPDVTVVTDEVDNCEGFVNVEFVSDDITSATCDGDVVTVTRTYSVTDCSGNGISVYQTINVDDITNPTASNPSPVSIECLSDIPDPDITVVTDEADNCDGIPTVAWVSDNVTRGSCDGATATVTRTYSVTDCSGNSIEVTQAINVDDVTNPTASNPATANVECFSDIPIPDVTVVTDEADNCEGFVNVEFVSDDITSATCDGDVVTVTRTYSVTDCSGNGISVYQTINVDDITNPTASNPAAVNVECFSDIPIPDVEVVTDEADNCEGFVNVEFVSDDITSATCDGDVVTVTRTYSVTDCSGNIILVTQAINVDDITNPTAICRDISVDLDSTGQVTITTDQIDNGSYDNCSGALTFALSKENFDCSDVGANTVILTATDCSGNSSTCSAIVTVNDITLPVITCKADAFKYIDPYYTYYTVSGDEFDATASDACGIDSLTYVVSGATSGTGSSLASVHLNIGTSTILWTAVDVNNNSTSCTTTVTVDKRPTTLIYNGDITEQYSDQTNLSATLTDSVSGLGIVGKTITFTIGTQSVTATTGTGGVATATLILTQSPVPLYYVVSAFVADSSYFGSGDSDVFDITPEDARVTFTGTSIVATASATSGLATVTLRATVQDISAVTGDPAYDAYSGDIRLAKVRFLNSNVPIVISGVTDVNGWMVPVLVNPSDLLTGVVSASWPVNIGTATDVEYTIGIEVGGYYIRNDQSDNTVITVYKPTGDFITGGGYVVPTQSAGQYAADEGRKTNFGFNVKYNKKGTNLQGNMNFIFRRTEAGVVHTYQIKSNAMISLGVNISNPAAQKAVFVSKANLTDITNPFAPVSLGGNLSLQVNMTDKGEPGVNDLIAISLWNGSTLLYSCNWTGSATAEMLLGGGNLVVHSSINVGPKSDPVTERAEAGITDVADKITMSVYPVPSSGCVNFKFSIAEPLEVTIDVYSITGVLVERIFNEYVESGIERIVTLNKELPEGVYFYSLQAGEYIKSGKFVVSH